MKWTEAIRVLSQSGLGALVLDSAGVILAVNPTGNELLHGEGRLKGKELPLFARMPVSCSSRKKKGCMPTQPSENTSGAVRNPW